MKKIILLAICFVFLFQASAFAESKLGVIDTQKIGADSAYGKEITTKLSAKFGTLEKELEQEANAVKKLKQKIDAGAFDKKLMPEKKMEFNQRSRNVSEKAKFFSQQVQIERGKLGEPFMKKVQDVVLEYGKKNGYSLILDVKTPGIAFVGDGIDVSADIIAELDKMKKAGK